MRANALNYTNRLHHLKTPIPIKKNHPPPAKDALWQKLKKYIPKKYRNFLIIIPSYNNKNWFKKNLDSVFIQDYPSYKVIYIDDCSSDKTSDLVEKYIKEKHLEDKIILVKNKQRILALANIYASIYAYGHNDDIAVVLDGDDWWNHDHVLSLINKVYDKFDIWMTYGQHELYPSGKIGIAQKLPDTIIQTNSFRNYKWVTSQQRTFYVWLFKLIKPEDLLYKGDFFPVAGDLATMFPMLEMAGKAGKTGKERSMFIQDVIYIYNRETPLNNTKIKKKAIFTSLNNFIRQKKHYSALEKRPDLSN